MARRTMRRALTYEGWRTVWLTFTAARVCPR